MHSFGLHRTRVSVTIAAMLIASCAPSISHAQDIDSSRGADSTVDYESLPEIGPWDDRNYQLTAKDLEILAPNESEATSRSTLHRIVTPAIPLIADQAAPNPAPIC